jgi:tubulin polyglutamylase TTLL6/13
MCFELLGFDVMLTEKCEPILIEINHTPSFSTDTPLDNTIKTNYIKDSLVLMNINPKTKDAIIKERKEACQQRVITGKKVKLTPEEKEIERKKAQSEREKYEAKNIGGFKKIYPIDDPQKMSKYQELLAYAE